MEGFLQHVAPQFLHPALQSFGCGAFRPIAGAFHPLYPAKAFSRHFGDQYALAQARQPFFSEIREDVRSPPPYRPVASSMASSMSSARPGSCSSPGSAASSSPDPRVKDDEATCQEDHDFVSKDNSQKLRCGVCGARLGPGVAQAHFMQELQHLYSLSLPPREPMPPHHDEDARWETYQRIKANRQRRLRMKTRKRHSVESLLYDDDIIEERPRKPEPRPCEEDEPVDVEGDSIGWPEGALVPHTEVSEKDQIISDGESAARSQLSYTEDLEISSTNDGVQSPEHSLRDVCDRAETPKQPARQEMTERSETAGGSNLERPPECVSTSEQGAWAGRPEPWGALAAEAYLKAASAAVRTQHHKPEGENQPSSTDPHN